jgi:hypothetical protein
MRSEATKSSARGRSPNPVKDESEDDAIRQSIARAIDELADPQIGDGSIDQAIREVQKQRGADDRPSGKLA